MNNQNKWNDKDYVFMSRAMELAASERGKTSPDPMVGAVLVKDDKIIGEGFHGRVKTPHAEAWAIQKAGAAAAGAVLYVNLEPCCFFKTKNNPPCSRTIIKSGIKKAFIAMVDPNPMVFGRGIKELKDAGVEIEVGLMEKEAKKLNEVFIKYVTVNRPFVTLKTAMTLDGKIATPKGESFWITGLEARKHAHYLRSINDAVMVGIGTIKKDNPELTVRNVKGNDPKKIIIDPKLEVSLKSKILLQSPEKTIICTTKRPSGAKKKTLEEMGAEILFFQSKSGQINLDSLMLELGKRKITSVLIEGGGGLNASALKFGIVDKINFFIAPKIIGGATAPTPVEGSGIKKISEAFQISNLQITTLGKDLLVEGYLIH